MQDWLAAVRVLFLAAITSTLFGCSAFQAGHDQSQDVAEGPNALSIVCSTNLTPEQQIELDAIDGLMSQSKNFAALARLETLSFSSQQHWLRWSELMGKLDQTERAEDGFRQIVRACDSAMAYHGLGVIHLKVNRVEEGLEALYEAKIRDPGSAVIRNDFGIALMRGALFGQAAFELRTAYELSGQQMSVARSMVAAYYLHGGDVALKKLQRETGLTEEMIASGIEFSRQFAVEA